MDGSIPFIQCTVSCIFVIAAFNSLIKQLFSSSAARDVQDGKAANECIQLDMAQDIITLLFEKELKVEIESECSV
jgi:hypothetical protein